MASSKPPDELALATPTVVDPRAPDEDARTVRWEPGQATPAASAPSALSAPAGAPHVASEPLRVVSMKTPSGDGGNRAEPPRERPALLLRSLADLQKTPPAGLGRLAPPRDPAEVRSRRVRDLAIWGSVAVIVACAVTLVIWFVAR